ncbi:MAG TPA: hypothetical protein VGG75_41810 [Trebonia sp.]
MSGTLRPTTWRWPTPEAAMAEYREWDAAGRPGEKSHEEFMAELLGDAR